MANGDDIFLVEALYSFKGKNNDELCFNKGDIITVTQREEGGWWEGTLNDKTGWFPSNYTKEHKIQDGGPGSPLRGDSQLLSPNHSQQQQIYKLTIVKEIIESERGHLAELQSLLETHLTDLQKSDILLEAEYNQLVGNLEDVCYCHALLVKSLEEQVEKPSKEQRVGGIFLSLAPQLQGVHKAYCTNHPRAVCMLEKYKDELNSFMEREGSVRPGIMVLTTALSKPFRRLDKYAGMLQEYERHLEEGHADRGDTQRSAHVYKELTSSCGAIRRQKELELEVITGRVHGWDGGESLGALGDVRRMGSIALLPDHRDRYLVLFPATLVMLSVSPRMSAFIFEGNYPLQSIHVTKLEDTDHYKNAFEIAGPLAERIIALCQTKEDQQQWVEVLSQQSRLARSSNLTPHKSSITSPLVSSAHVSDWLCSTDVSPVYRSKYACVTCGLPYIFSGRDHSTLKDSDISGSGLISVFACGNLLQHTICSCRIPSLELVDRKNDDISQSLVEHPNTGMYMGRPYTVLTKYFSNMYRRKVITKTLLRYLSGEKEGEVQMQDVPLRRHRSECVIKTGFSSSDGSSDEVSKVTERCLSGSTQSSESSVEGSIWVKTPAEALGATAMSTDSKKEESSSLKDTSNLQRWLYQGKELSVSSYGSADSSESTDGSNPYGYVRYYNPDDSNLGLRKLGDVQHQEESSLPVISPKFCSQAFINTGKVCQSISSEDSYYSVSHEMPMKPYIVSSAKENPLPSFEYSCIIDSEGNKLPKARATSACASRQEVNDNCRYITNDTGCAAVSSSKSLPVLMLDYDKGSSDSDSGARAAHLSVLNIPATPIIISGKIPPRDSDDFSDSTPNICNKTIYGNSTSSDDIMVLEKSIIKPKPSKAELFFKRKPDMAYYMSSCSGDEMGNDSGDYYENQRRHIPLSMPLSHSEPNLYYQQPDMSFDVEKLKYSSHYVQLVCDLDCPGKVCRCESYSHRSSDSGLADIVHHLESCPMRNETPGMGRGSCLSHCSQSSQFSGAKSFRCESSCQIRPLTPDVSGDCDSLMLTPLMTPHASNPVSYASESIGSIFEHGSLHYSPAHHTMCTFSGNSDSVFRSGLYAHWWMKASVCPKVLAVDRLKKDYLRFRVDKKPEVPPKPKFLKPSYHVRRGGIKGGVIKPLSKSVSTQTAALQSNPIRVLGKPSVSTSSVTSTQKAVEPSVSYSMRARLHCTSPHLSPQVSSVVPRDPSFESQSSQVSQITVIPKLCGNNFEIPTEPAERLSVPNRQYLSAIKTKYEGSQESNSTGNNSCFELSSLHSFNECCSKDGSPSHLRESYEDFDVDFQRRASSQSLCADVSDSSIFRSSVYCKLQPVHPGATSSESDRPDNEAAFGVGCEQQINKSKPNLPPKPKNLQSWPVQRSKSLPKLPISSICIHNKSKSSVVPRQASISSITSSSDSPVRHCRSPGGKVWSMSCLKPSPPLRPGLSPREEKRNQKHAKRKDDKWHEDDALILRVIEAYCTSAKTRYTVNSTLLDNPQVLIAEEEKIIVEETRGNQVVMEEKSLVDTVYALKDQVAMLLKDYQALKKAFEIEQQSSRNLRNIVKQHVLHDRDDIMWDVEA